MKKTGAILAALCLAASANAQTHQMDVNTKKLGAAVQPTMYGIFFEDINFAADGGLYGELIKNRSFEFTPDHLMGWDAFGKVEVKNDGPFEKNPYYVHLTSAGHRDMWTGLQNEGYFGIGLEKDAEYKFSVWARVPDGKPQTLWIQFVDQHTMGEHQEFSNADIKVDSKEWKKYSCTIKSSRTIDKANVRILMVDDEHHRSGTGSVDLEHISMFPADVQAAAEASVFVRLWICGFTGTGRVSVWDGSCLQLRVSIPSSVSVASFVTVHSPQSCPRAGIVWSFVTVYHSPDTRICAV